MAELTRFAIILVFVGALMSNSCRSNTVGGAEGAPFNLHYNAEPTNQEIYKHLVDADLGDKRVTDIIRYAKQTAHAAGYPLSGPDMDIYTFKGTRYPLETRAYENNGYYLILLTPGNMPETSHTLEISIQKKTKKIMTILQGG